MTTRLTTEFYLIIGAKRRRVNSYGAGAIDGLALPRVTTRKPKTSADEVAIFVTLTLPKMLFERPQFTASIAVDDSQTSAPIIDAGVVNNIETLVREQLGIDLRISEVPTAVILEA